VARQLLHAPWVQVRPVFPPPLPHHLVAQHLLLLAQLLLGLLLVAQYLQCLLADRMVERLEIPLGIRSVAHKRPEDALFLFLILELLQLPLVVHL